MCFSLNKSTPYLRLRLSLTSFSKETSRTWASLSLKTRWMISEDSGIWPGSVRGRHWLKPPTPTGTIITICMSYFMTGSPGKKHRTNSVQFSSVAQSCLTLCDPMNCSMPGLPVHHQLPEFTQTLVHQVGDAIQPSHPLSSPSPPARNPSQHQSLFQWVNSSHEVAKVLEFQL